MADFIAVDWGTTNRRIHVIAGGRAVHSERDDRGAATVTDFPGEVAALRARLGDLPMLLAGMVGSTVGWRTVPYVPAPAGLADIAAALATVAPGVRIVPGVATTRDVMRGEEVQLLGAVAAGLVPPDATLCQPGTHCKWVTMTDGRIADVVTAMTGELFALLRGHGLLARQLAGPVADGAAFRGGVAEGARRDLAASLFGIRAAGLLGRRDDAEAPSYASGLLIGADVAARLESARDIHVLSDPVLGGLYATAIRALGGTAAVTDSGPAFIAGIARLWELAA